MATFPAGSKVGSIGDLVCAEKEGMAGMCFARAREEFFKSRSQSDRSTRCYHIIDYIGYQGLTAQVASSRDGSLISHKSLKPGLMLV